MSERSEKTYISIHEFISSWEKEIYELTNLDYFAYHLINYLGNQIETSFLNKKQQTGYLKIDSEDIGTLAFNIGDSFASFLEHNCFGDCSLACPTKLNEKINPDEIEFNSHHFHLLQLGKAEDLNRKQFLLTDILNYVVLDTLFDFYNYEMGLDLDDSDIGLMQFADFITSNVEIFIEDNGQHYLKNSKESAYALFERLLQNSEQDWNELFQSSLDDEPEDFEEWKLGEYRTTKLIEEFLYDADQSKNGFEKDAVTLKYFQNYLEEYAGIDSLDEITDEDLEEYFVFWLIREIVLETDLQPEMIRDTLIRFFKWLDLTKDINLSNHFLEVSRKHFQGFKNSILIARGYFDNNSTIDGMLASNDQETDVVSALFLVEKIGVNGLIRLRDVFLKNKYSNVQISLPVNRKILAGMIIDASIKPALYGWQLINLEYVFPESARAYLH